VLVALVAGAGAIVLVIGAANAYILLTTNGDATADLDDVPPAQVAIVPGALVHDDGRMSDMLADRVRRAGELWRAGKVDRILVSGDHHTWGYDEPDTMRRALERAGVPGHDIFTDHAGFTQGFHMPRALYLAREAGLDATGLTTDLRPYGGQGLKSQVREIASRVKAVGDASLDTRVLLGPEVPITGNASASWGPPPPPRTPPAGAPRPLAR
jgi:SanA protein